MNPRSPVLAFGICFLLVASAIPAAAADLTAEQILSSMAKAYGDSNSYQDSGVVKTVLLHSDGTRTEKEKAFTTAFIRPDRFRFEYQGEAAGGRKERYIVWRDGQDVRSWWDLDAKPQKVDSLGMALAGATGVSSASAHTVPVLLLPEEVGGRSLTDITQAKRLPDAAQGQADCFVIQGLYADQPIMLWIDKETFLVRRIDSQRTLKDVRSERTTTYEPVINREVAEKMLEFGAPEQGREQKPKARK